MGFIGRSLQAVPITLSPADMLVKSERSATMKAAIMLPLARLAASDSDPGG